jgi:hypothetical protein
MRCTCEQAVERATAVMRDINGALLEEVDRLRRERAELFDAHHGTPCEQIRHAQEVAELKDHLAIANETIARMSRCMTASDLQKTREDSLWGYGVPNMIRGGDDIDT